MTTPPILHMASGYDDEPTPETDFVLPLALSIKLAKMEARLEKKYEGRITELERKVRDLSHMVSV